MLTVDILLLVAAFIFALIALVKNATPYLAVSVLLVVVDLLIHVIPR